MEEENPPRPVEGGPSPEWPHYSLYEQVKKALGALPFRFRTKLQIAGMAATDLFTLNTALGAAIEQSVVDNLNELRSLWDPDGKYALYSFVRQPQAFPDVRLQTSSPDLDPKILLGIELKGWFILSKEGEPSFRYKASACVCQPQDLLAVFPWKFDEVISGVPQLMRPFVTSARYAAEHRNHYWEYGRGAADGGIRLAEDHAPYPQKGARFNDEAVADSGGNFGRVARGGLMTEFIQQLMEEPLNGIPAKHWHAFLKAFADGATDDAIRRKIARIRAAGAADENGPLMQIANALEEIVGSSS
jgi:hypothetical protein